ncbi:MAG: tRNA uridine-5-carboxymethylaminomethyl(34) synthesis GTPase MnmE [Candidatus Omnitrophica bacterium]|nr:tRNA uridine-5-carboxymethylaminomethyl(34) synthesis GTPase MnmE [Candidatus Omnitrophota bacterium]
MQVFKLKDYKTKDTIVALSTYPAKSAIGLIRISGEKALKILSKIFFSKAIKDFKNIKSHKLYYGFIIDRKKGSNYKIIDEVLVAVMKKPNSYTKEDVVEINCHGGLLVIDKIVKLICKYGARLALPGEFTYRAFLHGRLDLLQAKSVVDIIEAKSEEALDIAIRQLEGEQSKKLNSIKSNLEDLFSHLEAYINFPDEEICLDKRSLKGRLIKVKKEISSIIQASIDTKKYQDGINCVICGKTNVGKSTLFNRLLKEERAITSSIAGTTRDVIGETTNLDGLTLKIFDTAGVFKTIDALSEKAIEKTEETFKKSDIILLVLDGSKAIEDDDYFFLNKLSALKLEDKKIIFVINKIDLEQKLTISNNFKKLGPIVRISALKNIGIEKLQNTIKKLVYKKGINLKNSFILNAYQLEILKNLRKKIEDVINFLEKNYTIDFVILALKEAIEDLGKLAGEIVSEDILKDIFSKFCIGK